MNIDFGVMDSLFRAKLEEKINWKESRELFLDVFEEDDEDYKNFKAMIIRCEGELDAYCSLLDMLILFIPDEYQLPKDRNRAFSVKIDVKKFRNMVDESFDEAFGLNTRIKFGNKELISAEDIEKQVQEKIKGKNAEEINNIIYYEDGFTSVYWWVDILLENMLTSYEGGDNFFE